MGDILIIKIDASGNLEWQERFGTEGVRETGIAIVETEDGGFIAGLGLAVDGKMQPALMAFSASGAALDSNLSRRWLRFSRGLQLSGQWRPRGHRLSQCPGWGISIYRG